MNPVRSKAVASTLGKWLENSIHFRPKSRICEEEVDCCGRPIKKHLKQADIIIEKNIEPSTFHTWKPKIPDLDRCVLGVKRDTCQGPKKKRKCHAGMQAPKCLKEVKKEAEMCYKKSIPCFETPKQKRGTMKTESEGSPSIDSSMNEIEKHSKKGICLPVSDWNHDGVMN